MLNIIFSDALIDEMLNKYGTEKQSVILIEEMSELTKELVKQIREKDNYDCLVEEMAHVMLSLSVVARVLDIKTSDVEDRLHMKFFDMGIEEASGYYPGPNVREYDLYKYRKSKALALKGEFVLDEDEDEEEEEEE